MWQLRGCLEGFRLTSTPDVVTFNTIIGAYSHYGYPMKTIFLFEKMVEKRILPTGTC